MILFQIGRLAWGMTQLIKVRKVVPWSLPLFGVLKFNMDGSLRGKPGPVVIVGVLCNSEGEVLLLFSNNVVSVTIMKRMH